VGLGVVLGLLLVLYVALKSQVLGIPSPTGFLFPDDRNDAVKALLNSIPPENGCIDGRE
jgi:hypothetical protein